LKAQPCAPLLNDVFLFSEAIAMRVTHRGERSLRALGLPAALGTAVAAQGQSGSSEDIKVHGHWKIVVQNPDGSIASSESLRMVDSGSIEWANLARISSHAQLFQVNGRRARRPQRTLHEGLRSGARCLAVEGIDTIGGLIKTNPTPTSLQSRSVRVDFRNWNHKEAWTPCW